MAPEARKKALATVNDRLQGPADYARRSKFIAESNLDSMALRNLGFAGHP